MFLVERLIGVGIYSLALIVVCVLIAYTKISYKSLLRFYAVLLAVMAFFYDPYVTADLYRIIHTMKIYASVSFSSFVKQFLFASSSPLPRVLYWILGRIGAYHLISSISSAICYGILFHMIEVVADKYKISRENIATALLLLMSTSIYISVIGGIRMMIAISLISFCFFRETVEGKRGFWNYFFYACALLTHNMALVFVSVRIFVTFIASDRKLGSKIKILALFFGALAVTFFAFRSFFNDILEKIAYYLFDESYSDTWEYIMGVLILCLFVTLCLHFRRIHYDDFREVIPISMGAVISAVIALLFFNVFSFFYRFIGHIVPILSIPMLMLTLEHSKVREGRFKHLSFQSVVLVFSILILALSLFRGSLSSLKFFTLGGSV